MAERRMFARKIIDSDAFLEMSASAQALYFHLGTRADDDGFVNNPKKIQRMIGAADDDLKILIAKRFVIIFESGVIVIKHWRMHNYIRADRYKETEYIDEKSQLTIKENGTYTLNGNHLATTCLPDGNHLATACLPDGNHNVPQLSPGCPQVRGDNRGDIANIANKDYIYNIYTESESDIYIDNESDKYRYMIYEAKEGKKSTARSDKIASAQEAIPVITLPLNDNSQHPITQAEVDRFSELYPAVDVPQALRAMAGWLEANPTKRKTRRGVMRFVNSWLSRDQDKGGTRGYSGSPASAQKPSVKYD